MTRSVWIGITMALAAQAAGFAVWLRTESGSWAIVVEAIFFICGIGIVGPYLDTNRQTPQKQAEPQTGSQATLARVFLAVATLALMIVAVALATDVERSARSMALGFLAEFPTAAVGLCGYMMLSPRIRSDAEPALTRFARRVPTIFWGAALVTGGWAFFELFRPHPLNRPFPHDITTYMLAAGSALMVAAAVEAARRVRVLAG